MGGCGAFIVVQAAMTPPSIQLSFQSGAKMCEKPASMQAGKMMFRSGMFDAEELTITGASKEPGLGFDLGH